jgi:hypothetical protein
MSSKRAGKFRFSLDGFQGMTGAAPAGVQGVALHSAHFAVALAFEGFADLVDRATLGNLSAEERRGAERMARAVSTAAREMAARMRQRMRRGE